MNAIYSPSNYLQGKDFTRIKKFFFPWKRSQRNIFLLFALFFSFSISVVGQTNPNEAEWNGSGYSIKKVVSNTTIASGVNFSYTILFTAPAGATTVSIQDAIPASLVAVSVPPPAIVNGVTPVVSITGAPGSQVVNYTLTGLPSGSPSSGSFTIVVKFPEGTTCNGATARNRVGILVNDKWEYTPYVSTSATATDPWVVSKSILSGPVVNPSGGSCGYIMSPGDTVTYRLSVMKTSPYYGNVVGQQNMTSAVVTDVLPAGAIMLSSTCGIPANSTGTITWQPNSGLLDAANPWAYYYCDITVYYPAASFPNGSFVYNQISLTGSMCNQQPTHQSNQTCIEIGQVVANPNAFFQKYISLTNRVPGCSGLYTIVFCNNGNVPLSAFNIDDVIPSGVSVTQVAAWGGSATTTMNITANSGANTIASGINSNYFTSGSIGYPVNDLQLQMTGSLPVGNCIYLYVYFTVNPNPTGTVVTNCATFNGLSNSLTLPQTCASFTVDAGTPHPCILKDICSPKTSYDPGDIVRFRIRVQNIGSASITGASFQDVLNGNFTYLGNESYYVSSSYNPPCSTGGGIPVGTTAWSGVTASHSGNNLNWSLPTISSDCQLFYVGYCGYYGTWGLPFYYIEFDVQINNTALPGVTPNNYTISGGNLTAPATSNTVNVLVVASFGQEVKKEISTNNGTSFASSGVVSPGGTARYRLNYKNTSNVPVSSVSLVDLLPRNDGANDWLVLNRSIARGSQFDATYNANHGTSLLPVATAPSRTLNFAPGLNICLPAFGLNSGCNPTTWASTPSQNVRINYGTFILNPNVTIREDFDVSIPSTATLQQTVCNDFAAISTAGFLLNGVPQNVTLTPIAAPPVCLTVGDNASSCCDSVRIEQAPGADGVIGCCARITTKCDVDSVAVSLGSGSISGVNWNCGTLPSGFIGQSNFTFVANACALDMTTCIEPAQTGITIANFTIYFSNGDTCKKTIDLDCTATPADCCDSVRVEQVYDPASATCCARIISECEIKSINVSVTNGTLSATSWNCGTLPSGYIGQSSYTFAPGTCLLDMTNCVAPTQSGSVTVTYTINFANGLTCDKTIEIQCEADINCCDSVEVRQFLNSDGTAGCCTEIITKCEVDSISVSVLNGTLSNASWNCGTIPAGYVGQSNYTFVTANCMADLVTCMNALQTGVVTVNYVVYFSNGEKCEKTIKLDCKAETCCEKAKLEKVINSDGSGTCCVKLTTECEVKSVNVSVTNGVISSATWNCGTLPPGFTGQSNFTFAANSCVLSMKNCFEPTQSGIVSVTYTINFQNGETCKKTIELDCKKVTADCCALIDFKLKQKWPHFSTQIGTFSITNLNPSSPICSVVINASPSATFTTGGLVIDGSPSTQTWNPSSIPSAGTLSPAAVNTIVFSLASVNYHGNINVCVVKCDGTKCCFDFKWNPKIIIGVDVEVGQLPPSGKLFAVTVNPKVSTATSENVKYISFGMRDQEEISGSNPEFFAISSAEFQGDEYPAELRAPAAAYMSKYNAFFELSEPVKAGNNLGAFNLVFSKILPKLGCTLFNEEGNIIFSGDINVTLSDTVKTAVLNPAAASENLFDFINLYPNPSNGAFNITYATGNQRNVEIRIINPLGQVADIVQAKDNSPGIHNVQLINPGLSQGLYKVVLISEGQILSKSAIIKE